MFSFKIRGAYNKLARRLMSSACGVIAASAGNHAQGWPCRPAHGVKATIVMPRTTPEIKVKAARPGWQGGTARGCVDEALAYAQKGGGEGLVFIHRDDPTPLPARVPWPWRYCVSTRAS